MVTVQYTADVPDLDKPAVEAQAERPGKPLRLRLQPTILRLTPAGSTQHLAWPSVVWAVEVETAQELIAVRKALEAFFVQLGQHGGDALEKALTPEMDHP